MTLLLRLVLQPNNEVEYINIKRHRFMIGGVLCVEMSPMFLNALKVEAKSLGLPQKDPGRGSDNQSLLFLHNSRIRAIFIATAGEIF